VETKQPRELPRAPALTPETRLRLEQYLELLYRENTSLNLTRVPREDAWGRHIEQSLSLLGLALWRDDELALDLGSGGGVPGVPLAIVLPRVRFVLVERQRNKAAFLDRCVSVLGLEKVEVVARDATELGRQAQHPRARVLVARAVAPPLRLVPTVAPLLAEGGEALLMVGESFRLDQPLRRLCASLGLSSPRLMETGRARILAFRRQLGARPPDPTGAKPRLPGEGALVVGLPKD